MSIRAALEQYSKRAAIAAEVDGIAVYFRRFNSREYEEFLEQSRARFRDDNFKMVGASAWFLVRALCDENGERLYQDNEQPEIAKLDAVLVDALVKRATEVCIPHQIDEAAAEKNSQTPGDGSGFA